MILLIFLLAITVLGLVIKYTKPGFEMRKSNLMNLYSSVLSDMNMDFRDTEIGAINIAEISKSIKNFSDEIDSMKDIIPRTSSKDQEWFIDMIQEFTDNLHLWIKRHANELEILESSINDVHTLDISERAVLELASKRLENHVKLLERT